MRLTTLLTLCSGGSGGGGSGGGYSGGSGHLDDIVTWVEHIQLDDGTWVKEERRDTRRVRNMDTREEEECLVPYCHPVVAYSVFICSFFIFLAFFFVDILGGSSAIVDLLFIMWLVTLVGSTVCYLACVGTRRVSVRPDLPSPPSTS